MTPLVFGPTSAGQIGSPVQSLGTWLNALSVFQAPTRIVQVGFGPSVGEAGIWLDWPLSQALIIDAESIDLDVLKLKATGQAQIETQTQVIAEKEGSTQYFVASNPSENGLVDPNLLRMVWPSLALSHRTQCDAKTLDQATTEWLHAVSDPISEPLWLILDALPAVRILTGGTQLLASSSLVCVRVLSEAGFRGEPSGADLNSVDQYLAQHNFKRVIYLPGLNPKVGHAIYARTQQINVLSQERDTLIGRVSELEKQLDTERAASSVQYAEAVRQHEQAQAVLESELTKAQQQATQQTQEKELALKQLTELQTQISMQIQAKDEALQKLAELQKDIAAVTQAKDQALKQFAEAKQSGAASETSLKQSSENLQALQAKLDAALKECDASNARILEAESKLSEAQKQTTQQTQAKEQALKQLTELKSEVTTQTQEKDQALQQLAELQKDIATVTQAKDQALQQLAEAKKSGAASEESLKLTKDNLQALQIKLDEALKERDTYKTRMTDSENKLEVELKTSEAKYAELTHQQEQTKIALNSQISEIQKSLETTIVSLKEKEEALEQEIFRAQKISAENQELAHRQRLMNEELVKAEGQIALIKDLLLREQGI